MLSMPKEAILTFREFFQAYPSGIYTTTSPVNQEKATSVPPARPTISAAPFEYASIDDDTIILCLDAIQDAGGTITRATLDAIQQRDFAACGHYLILALTQRGLISCKKDVCTLTHAAFGLLHQLHPATPPPRQEPSQFDSLRSAVQTARQRHTDLAAAHLQHQPARLDLDRQLAESRDSHHTAQQNIETLQARLQKAQEHLTVCRNAVLRLEDLKRNLPDTAALDQAKRDLTAAETAYQTYVQL